MKKLLKKEYSEPEFELVTGLIDDILSSSIDDGTDDDQYSPWI